MNWILLHFPESKISRIDRPIVRANLLLPRIIIFVRFQIKLSNLLTLWHILARIDGLFDSISIFLGGDSILEGF